MPGLNTARIEEGIARAHKSLSFAQSWASEMSDLGLHDDLQLVLLELERLQLDLLRGGRRPSVLASRPTYLSDSPRDDGRPPA